jgi:putative transposase
MWTTENRQRYNRDRLRYPTDLTDEEWSLVEKLIPNAKRGGRKREVDMRETLNGIMYVLGTSCQWRAVPKDLPPRSTLYGYFQRWQHDRTLGKIHFALYQKCREREGREASPTACIVDSQSVKSVEKGGKNIDPNGYDAGKKVSGIKRHLLVDMLGLPMHCIVHTADIQDRDGGILLLDSMFGLYPFIEKLFADGGYQGPQFRQALATAMPGLSVEIVKRSDTAKGFTVLPKRWIVERTIAWLNRCRRLAKDFENLHRNALAFIKLAGIRLMLRKLCNSNG